ncbi:pleckstrin homology domain-containing family G member 6 isoform X5 [Pseudorca crassidens]|uniref:pleckstrin homology domain-containing family G member 6 isoform X5 n=1 Tax=Pseudorca crassidens TaxID=82174 RepID=UPI00352F41CA
MHAFGPPNGGRLQGLVASRIETYGGRLRASTLSTPGSLYPRGGPVLVGRGVRACPPPPQLHPPGGLQCYQRNGHGGAAVFPSASRLSLHLEDPSGRHLQGYVPFTKGSGPARGLSPLRLREPEPEKRHGGHFGAGTPHFPKLKEVTRAHQLEMRLHTFSMFGMPRLPPEDRRHWEIGEDGDSSLAIEKSWKELVPGHKEMSRELCHQQEALWELLTTELIYVRKLKIMTDLLAAGLLNLQRVGLLTEPDPSPPELLGRGAGAHPGGDASLGPASGPGQPAKRLPVGSFPCPVPAPHLSLQFSQRFQPYVLYCLRVKQTMAYAWKQQDNDPLFRTFLQWCEKHKRSGRQTLGDLLIKPHQRITKYPLLLQAVLKRTPEARAREALTAMIAAVESFLRHINKQVRQREEQESLAAAAQRIGPYEVLEPSSEEVEKLDVYLFLFSDVLLVTKPLRRADKAKVIRPPLMLEKLVCRPLRDPSSFLLIHLTELQCVSSALTVHCPSAADRAMWLERTQQAQVTLQKLKAEEYIQQKRELLALYQDRDGGSPGPRPSMPSVEGSESSTEGSNCRTPGSSIVIPQLVVTEDTDEDAPLVPDDISDSGYGTLVPGSPKASHFLPNRLRSKVLRRDPRRTFSTLDLRDVPLHLQPPDPQAPQRRSTPELPEASVQKGDSLPRGDPPTWSEEEGGTSVGENVVVETLHRARLRWQLSPSLTHTDSSGESPWESSGDEEEGPFLGPGYSPSPHPLWAEDMLREIREELASQRIERVPEPGDSRPRKLTRVQLQRMRGLHVIRLDTPLSASEV